MKCVICKRPTKSTTGLCRDCTKFDRALGKELNERLSISKRPAVVGHGYNAELAGVVQLLQIVDERRRVDGDLNDLGRQCRFRHVARQGEALEFVMRVLVERWIDMDLLVGPLLSLPLPWCRHGSFSPLSSLNPLRVSSLKELRGRE